MKHSVLFLILLTAPLAFSQLPVSLGVKGGAELLEPALTHDESRRYIVGPTVEVRLPAGFALEADALYERVGSSFNSSYIFSSVFGTPPVGTVVNAFNVANRLRGNQWEFPLLGKYYFHRSQKWQPFVSTGFAFRTVGYQSKGISLQIDPKSNSFQVPFTSEYRSNLDVGAVAAAGVRYRFGRLAVAPEFRYTRWGSNDNALRKNSASLFLGLSF